MGATSAVASALADFYTTVMTGMSLQAKDGVSRKSLLATVEQAMRVFPAIPKDAARKRRETAAAPDPKLLPLPDRSESPVLSVPVDVSHVRLPHPLTSNASKFKIVCCVLTRHSTNSRGTSLFHDWLHGSFAAFQPSTVPL